MNRSLRLGIELPPLPPAAAGGLTDPAFPEKRTGGTVGGDWRDGRDGRAKTGATERRLHPWWQLARAGMTAGARSIWLAGEQPDGGGDEDARWRDPCTAAAAMVPGGIDVLVGVVSPLPSGRHPWVLAREVTMLDVLSDGRAALALYWDAPPPTDVTVACEHLGDAVAVCAAALRGGGGTFDGRHLRISGAWDRPPPRQAGGPPILVTAPPEVLAELSAQGRRQAAAGALIRSMAVLADAVICWGDPSNVASWRSACDRTDMRGHPVLWAVTASDHRTAAPAVAARVRDAGADGVIVRVAPSFVAPPRGGSPGKPDSGRSHLGELASLVAGLYAPWSDGPE